MGPPPGFPSAVLGLSSVHGVAVAPAVLTVASPLFRPFAAAVSSDPPVVSSAPAPFVSAPRFPHAAAPAAPSSLPPRFPHAAAPAAPSNLPRFPHAAAPADPSSLPLHFPHAAAPAAPFAFGPA